MLKTTPLASSRPSCTQLYKNRLVTDSGGGVGGEGIKNLSIVEKLVKSKKLDFAKVKSSGADFHIFRPKKAFLYLRNGSTKALILHYFDTGCYIYIKTNTLKYAIDKVISQMTLDQLLSNHIIHENLESNFSQSEIGQWHPVAFFSLKMLPIETWYETLNQKLLAIMEVFKTWRYYLEGYKYEVCIFIDHKKLRQFMITKNLSSHWVPWAQKLSHYNFHINYC